MKTKIFVISFIAVSILLGVLFGRKQQEINSVSNQIPVPGISESEKPDKILVILDSIEKTQVDTFSFIESPCNNLAEIESPYNNLVDWNELKKAFQQWRENEISKGYYVESCLDNPEAFIEKYGDKWMTGSLRYALPDNPEEFTTYKADINFDRKQEVIVRIFPIDCVNGCGLAAHEPLYVTFLSRQGHYIVDNTFIHKVEKTIRNFRKQFSNREYQWILIDDIKSERGIIVISGNSYIHLDNDVDCCPSIEFDFTVYMDKTGKEYMLINGVYKNQLEEKADTFNFKLRIE